MNHFFLITSLLLTGCATVASKPKVSCYHSDEAIEKDIGYCQAVRSGTTLHISGVAGKGEMNAAMRSVYGRLEQVLKANGLKFSDVVKETVFTTDLDSFIKNKAIRKDFYRESLPAASWIEVKRLYLPSFVLEVELTAQYSK